MSGRVYLVVIDDTAECAIALRYAAQRAAHVGGKLILLHVTAPPGFQQWGAIEDAMRAEAHAAGEALLDRLSAQAEVWGGRRPETLLREGEPAVTVLAVVRERGVAMLVLATATAGAPGPLIAHFTGERAAALPCLVAIVPGALSGDELDGLT